jgi:hypothetical protein
MPTFKARYAGRCAACKQCIAVGDLVTWCKAPGARAGTVKHQSCDDSPQEKIKTDGTRDQQQQQPPPEEGGRQPEQFIRDLAREVAQEEDLAHTAEQLGQILEAVDARIREQTPQELHINTHLANGKVETIKVKNAHKALPGLVYLITKRRHTYLHGPPGGGKSTGAVQAAQCLGLEYGYTSLNPQTPESRLLGFVDAGGVYRETEFYRRYTQGGVFCIDELDNGHPALLNTINGMLEVDHDGIGRGAFPHGVHLRHADFVCVGTGNTNGRGADKLFPERRAFDAAFFDRFAFVEWGNDVGLERALVRGINKTDGPAWCNFVIKVRKYAQKHGIRLWATPRASFVGADLLKDSGWTVEKIAETTIFKGFDPDTRSRILAACPLPVFGGEGDA